VFFFPGLSGWITANVEEILEILFEIIFDEKVLKGIGALFTAMFEWVKRSIYSLFLLLIAEETLESLPLLLIPVVLLVYVGYCYGGTMVRLFALELLAGFLGCLFSYLLYQAGDVI
jgi:hypothetical protein